jgi:hypothetical protein
VQLTSTNLIPAAYFSSATISALGPGKFWIFVLGITDKNSSKSEDIAKMAKGGL